MKPSVEDQLLAESVQLELGAGVPISPAPIGAGTLWGQALSSITGWLGHKVHLIVADSDLPEIFCLDSQAAPAVVFSNGYLQRLARFRIAMYDPDLGDARGPMIEQLCLETAGLYCLKAGDPDTGSLLYQRSLNTRTYLIDDAEISRQPPLEPSGRALIQGLFAIVHEIGHVNRDIASVVAQLTTISDATILDHLQRALDNMPWATPELRQYATDTATKRRRDHFLGLDNLRREALSDIFAGQRLYAIAQATTKANGVTLDPVAFMAALHLEFNAVNALERIKLFAKSTTDFPIDPQRAADTCLFPAAMAIRSSLLVLGLLGFVKPLLPESSELAEGGRLIHEWVQAMESAIVPTLEQCDNAIVRALDATETDLILTAPTTLEQTRFTVLASKHAAIDARRFLTAASRFDRADTPLIRTLERIVSSPESWDGQVDGQGRKYVLALALDDAHDTPRFLTIPLRDRPGAVPAFLDRSSMEVFGDLAERFLAPGESLSPVEVEVQHLAQLEAHIESLVNGKITLVVEGTSAFEHVLATLVAMRTGEGNPEWEAAVEGRKLDALAWRYEIYAKGSSDPATPQQFADILRLLEDG